MEASDALVAAQAVALAGVAWPGGPRWPLPAPARAAAATLACAGAGLALAGLRPHGAHVSPRVRPPAGASLMTGGAYSITRHPIYVGLGACSAGVALLRRRPGPLVSSGILTVVLAAKAVLEERALAERFGPEYRAYAARTPRLPRLRRRAG